MRQFYRSALLVAGASLLGALPLAAQAQQKAAPRLLEMTTSSATARTALAGALVEVENIGGGRRFDAALKSAVDADPQFALARAYYAGWNTTLSAAERDAEFQHAIKDAAGASAAELLLITAFREQRAGRPSEARAIADVVRKLASDDPHVLFFRTLVAADGDEAIKLGEESLQRFPDYAPPVNLLAYRLNSAGRKDEAIAMVQKYVAMMPNHPNPYDSYAEILALQGRLDESDAQYRRALEVDPTWEVGHEGMAANAFKRGNPAGARAHLEQSVAAATTPQRRITLMRELATAYVFENNMGAAIQQLTNAVQAGEAANMTASAKADHRSIGMLLAAQGKTADAVQHYQAGAEAKPGVLAPLSDAMFHALLGHAPDVATAAAAMQKNAADAPDNAGAQDAMHAAQAINAVMSNDVAAAKQHHAAVKAPVFRALGGAFLIKPLTRSGDKSAVSAANADVNAFTDLNLNAAIVRLIARRK